MNCAIKLKGYEVAGSTFQDRKFIFTDRDISGDVFTAVVYNSFSKKNNIEGLKDGNEVLFPYSTLENLKTGRYRIEFWATMAGIGKEMIALEEFFISSDPSCTNGSNETNVSITFKEEVINFTIQTALMCGAIKWENIEDKPEEFPPSAHTHQWDKIEGKPTVFFDDTEIKEEIAKKVDKVAGKSLSTNDFTDAEKVKLASLENFDDSAIQTELDTKVDKVDGFGLSKNNFSDAEQKKLENLQNFDPSGIIQDLGNKVDKIAGKGLSDNNYSTADKTKLDNINLSNYVLQTSLNSQLTSYVLQSNLNTQLQSYATLNGVQTFSGTKTFTEAPIVPTATLNSHAVNLGQLNSLNSLRASKFFSGDVNTLTTNEIFRYYSGVLLTSTNLFTTTNNANAIISINRYENTNHTTLIGFNSLGDVFVKNLNASTAIWEQVAFRSWVSKQTKIVANISLSTVNDRATIIATENRTVTVPTGLSDNFECTFIADGGTITFANSGTVFKFNNSKVTLLSGGIATLRKENGTNNFYLKGDLT